MSSPTVLTILGQTVPFDGKPRLDEVQAYAEGAKEAATHTLIVEQTLAIVKHMAPAIINARLRPETPFVAASFSTLDDETSEGIAEVINAIKEKMLNPKLMAALGMTIQTPSAAKK